MASKWSWNPIIYTVVGGVVVLAAGKVWDGAKTVATKDDLGKIVCALCSNGTIRGDSVCFEYRCQIAANFTVGGQQYEATLASKVPVIAAPQDKTPASVDAAKAPFKVETPSGQSFSFSNPVEGFSAASLSPFMVLDVKDKSNNAKVPASSWGDLFERLKAQPQIPVIVDMNHKK